MKTKLSIFYFLLLFITSCNSREKYIGEWECRVAINGQNLLRLYDDGRYIWYREKAIIEVIDGEWEVNGKTFLYSNSDIPETKKHKLKLPIVRINDHQLFLRDETFGFVYEFHRNAY